MYQTYYMVIVEDTHADPTYEVFAKREDAMSGAFRDIEIQCNNYRDLTSDDMDYLYCDGSNGYYLIAQSPCGSFSVKVVDIEVPIV
jgi:hypothetical protein